MSQEGIPTSEFVGFSTDFASIYLSNGGPTSRLENMITQMGHKLNIESQAFAQSTGIFVSGRTADESHITGLARIKKGTRNLAEVIRLEGLFHSFMHEDLGFYSIKSELTKNVKEPSNRRVHAMAFVLGVAVSYSLFGLIIPSLLSGSITALVSVLSGPMNHRWGLSRVFSDFFATFVALVLSAVCATILAVPIQALAFGTFVLLVPGLAITNAVSELAEENLISGTAKLMKSLLVVLAMGTAYLFVSEMALVFELDIYTQPRLSMPIQIPMAAAVLCYFMILMSVTVIFNIGEGLIWGVLLTGFASWGVLQLFNNSPYVVLGSFFPALAVGLISLFLGKWLKVPSQVFSVPGIFALVPGTLALSSFDGITEGVYDEAPAIAFQVALVSSSITFGLFTARLPFLISGTRSLDD